MSKQGDVDSFSESSSDSNDSDDCDAFLWGCTLTRQNPIARWGDRLDDSRDPASCHEHTLSLRQAVLGFDAVEGERNVVAVGSEGFDKEKLEFPIVCLSRNHQEMCSMTMNFHWPAVFRLSQGSGPVTLTGEHHVAYASDEDDDDDEDVTEMDSASSSSPAPSLKSMTKKMMKEKKTTSPKMGNRMSTSSKDSSKFRAKKTRRSESSDRPGKKQKQPMKSESKSRTSKETGAKKAAKKKVTEGKKVAKKKKANQVKVKVEPD